MVPKKAYILALTSCWLIICAAFAFSTSTIFLTHRPTLFYGRQTMPVLMILMVMNILIISTILFRLIYLLLKKRNRTGHQEVIELSKINTCLSGRNSQRVELPSVSHLNEDLMLSSVLHHSQNSSISLESAKKEQLPPLPLLSALNMNCEMRSESNQNKHLDLPSLSVENEQLGLPSTSAQNSGPNLPSVSDQASGNCQISQVELQQQRHTLISTVIILVVFLMSFLPMTLMLLFQGEVDPTEDVTRLCACLILLTSVVNPYIYMIRSNSFRQAFAEVYCIKNKSQELLS